VVAQLTVIAATAPTANKEIILTMALYQKWLLSSQVSFQNRGKQTSASCQQVFRK
jgi:hypothetical protein